MDRMQEGYVKFSCDIIAAPPPEFEAVREINEVRSRLYQKRLIGMYPNGVGFGNISARRGKDMFYISGTRTGGLPVLSSEHYVLVTNYDIGQNFIRCEGAIKASSESLTHAAVYQAQPSAKTVIHIHSVELWKKYRWILPSTAAEAEYGSPEMALEIGRIILENSVRAEGLIIMGGHEEGIIAYASCPAEAEILILSLLENKSL